MPQALWLATQLDGSTRRIESGCRVPVRVPPVPELRSLLQTHGGPGFDVSVLSMLGKSGIRQLPWLQQWGTPSDSNGLQVGNSTKAVLALLIVAAEGAKHDDGLLTPWSEEECIQRIFHGEPPDCYSVHVDDFRQVADPTYLEFKWRNPTSRTRIRQRRMSELKKSPHTGS